MPKISISEIKVNSRFRKAEGDLTSLVESIKDVGLLHPIVVSEDNELIAGWRRLRAVQLLGWKEIPVNIVNLKDLRKGEVQENLVRKDFTPSEMVAIKRFYEVEEKAKAEQRMKATLKRGNKIPARENFHSGKKGKSRDILGGYVGVSGKTLQKAEKVVEAAKENPEKFEKIKQEMDNGKRSVQSAFSQIKEAKRKEQREKDLAEISKQKWNLPEDVTLYQGDFLKSVIPEDSVQLILTDPPYPEKYLELWDKLAEFAQKVLVKGGFLISYCGHFHLPSVIKKLDAHLSYFWIMALTQPQHVLVHSRHVFCDWKPLLIFYKPPLNLPAFFGDVINGKGPEKQHHNWQQGLAELEQIIPKFCPENGVILDPFAGSGTTLLAAKKLGRKAIGIESNPETFVVMKKRLLENLNQK